MKKIRVYETRVVERELNGCEDCPKSSITASANYMGCICTFHQRVVENTDYKRHHVDIPDWCKIDECPWILDE